MNPLIQEHLNGAIEFVDSGLVSDRQRKYWIEILTRDLCQLDGFTDPRVRKTRKEMIVAIQTTLTRLDQA